MTEPLWRDLTHQQVWEQVNAGPGPYVSDGAATAWSNAQAALRQIDGDLGAAITKAAGWTGQAADATRRGLTPLGGWAVDATGSAGRAAASLTEHQVQVAWVRANLPEPGPATGVDPPIPLSDAGVDPAVLQNWTVTVGRNTALADQAFHVMDTYATNTALIQQQVPTWTPPPAVTMSVADRPPPSRAVVTTSSAGVPTTVVPASALAIAGTAASGAVGSNATQRPAGGAVVTDGNAADRPAGGPTSQDGNGVDRLPSATSTGSIPATPPPGERATASHDGSASFAPGAVAGGALPNGPGGLRDGPDGAPLLADGTAGGPAGVVPRTGSPGPTRNADGVLRGFPDGRDTGILRGAPNSGGGSRGGGLLGGQPGDPAGRGGTWTDPEATLRGSAAAPSAGRPLSTGSPGYLPMGAAGLGNRGDTHRRPDYLVGTYSFFADDRVLTGPLITPEEPLPVPT